MTPIAIVGVLVAVFGVIGLIWLVGVTCGAAPPPFPWLFVRRKEGLEWEHYKAPDRYDGYDWYWKVAYKGEEDEGRCLFWGDSWNRLIKASWAIARIEGTRMSYRGRTSPCIMCGGKSGVGERFCSRRCLDLHTKAVSELPIERPA